MTRVSKLCKRFKTNLSCQTHAQMNYKARMNRTIKSRKITTYTRAGKITSSKMKIIRKAIMWKDNLFQPAIMKMKVRSNK